MRQTQLMDEAGDPRQLRAELQELEGRHIDALELMGETSEENEELKDRVQGLRMEVDRLTEQPPLPWRRQSPRFVRAPAQLIKF